MRKTESKMPRGLLSASCWLAVRFYQLAVSPILHLIPGSGCRFYPTCSEYTLIAISRHGAFKGVLMGACRILRCNPFCEGGFDYVPREFSWRKLFSQNKVDEPAPFDN